MEKYSLNDIAGYAKEKEELLQLVDVLNNKEKYFEKGGYIPKGIMLYGDPGNGKTLFAKVLASMTNVNFIEFDITQPNVAANLKKVFEEAREKAPSIVFIDEINKIVESDDYVTDDSRKNLSMLLSLIDGFNSQRSNEVFVVATANDYDEIPPSLVRPGRIDKKLYIDYPDDKSRKEILELYIAKTKCKFDIDMARMVKFTSSLSCSGIMTLVNECVLASKDDIVDEALFIKKVNAILDETINTDYSYQDDLVVAAYEVGQFIVARHFSYSEYMLDVNQNGSSKGKLFGFNSVEDDDDDEDEEIEEDKYTDASKQIGTKSLYRKMVMYAGGIIVCDTELEDYYDLNKYYFKEINSIIDKLFLMGEFGYEYTLPIGHYDDPRSDSYMCRRELRTAEIMRDVFSKAQSILSGYGKIIGDVVKLLAKKRVLDDKELEPIIKEYFEEE